MKTPNIQHPTSRENPSPKPQLNLRMRVSWCLRFGASLVLGCWMVKLPAARAETILLNGATVHTVSGEILSPGQVLVKDGKIAAVGTALSAAGAETIELKGQHLYPGLIALNTSLGLTETSAVRATQDSAEVGDY